tara:strand:- start:165 stop:350 length:186 start_codon:yes stop_codon:yes gene_type:complete
VLLALLGFVRRCAVVAASNHNRVVGNGSIHFEALEGGFMAVVTEAIPRGDSHFLLRGGHDG